MEFQIIPKKETNLSYAKETLAVKSIEYCFTCQHFDEQQIDSARIDDVLNKVREGEEEICLFAGPDEESDRMEIMSNGTWLSLTCCFDLDKYYFCYNEAFAETAALLDEADFFDETVYTGLESGGQSPIPKIQAITDLEAGIQAVEYFIYTGQLYPGIDWITE